MFTVLSPIFWLELLNFLATSLSQPSVPSPAFSGEEKISIFILPEPSTLKGYWEISGSSSFKVF